MAGKKGSCGYTKTVPAVDQASKILFFMAKNRSKKLSLTDICRGVGIHKSKGYSILSTLSKYGLVHKDLEDKHYMLGLGILSLSRKVMEDLDYVKIASSYLDKISRITKTTAILGLIREENLFVVAKRETEDPISVTIRLGHSFHVTYGAHGKAIASFLDEKELAYFIKKKKAYFFGDPSAFDRKRLDLEMEACRLKGFAYDIGELYPGISAISSPVFDSRNRVIGVFLILGTYGREKVEELGRVVYDAAKDFSLQLGADPEATYKKFSKSEKGVKYE